MPARALRLTQALAIFAFAIALSACGNNGQVTCGMPCEHTVGGEFLFATSTNGQVLSFQIDQTSGALNSPTSSVSGPAQSLGLAASGPQFLYASDTQNAQIFGFAINATDGSLTTLTGSPFPTGQLSVPAGLAGSLSENVLYSTDVATVDAFSISNGTLTPISGPSLETGNGLQLALSPNGKFLFETDVDPPNGVIAFTVDSTGVLTPVVGSPFPVSGQTILNSHPFGITTDFSGKFVYVALTFTNQVAGWSVDQTTGVLTPVPGSPFDTGDVPLFVAATSKYLYITTGGAVSAYSIDSTTGALTPLNGSPFAISAAGLTIDEASQRLYTSSHIGIMGFNINTDGSLTAIQGSPFSANSPLLLTTVQIPVQ